MQITIGEKEYTIKYGIEATAKSGLFSKLVQLEEMEMTLENLEIISLVIAETMLVGLQNKHSDEFGYDYNTEEGKEKQLSKVCDLLDEYTDENEDSDLLTLYGLFREELMKNGFLKSLFNQMKNQMEKENPQTKVQAAKKTTTKKTTKKAQ